MEDPRGYNSAEEYRAIQELVREGRHLEAIERAQSALSSGLASRKHAARLHSLICQVWTETWRRPSPVAILHGEEAVRLACVLRDPWVKCEALAHLVHAYCETGDLERAAAACESIATELAANDAVIPGGRTTILVLQARVAAAKGDWAGALLLLQRAEDALAPDSPVLAAQIHAGKVRAVLEQGSEAKLQPLLQQEAQLVAVTADRLEALVIKAWLAEMRDPPAARRLAQQAHQHCLAAGRVDLVRTLRRRFSHLL